MKFASQVYTKASGSAGGLTYSHNRGGMYTRARATPVNTFSSFRTAVKDNVGTLAGLWNSVVTAAQRAAWGVFAVNVPSTNSLGASIQLSGLNWYIKFNSYRLQAGVTRIDVAPVIFELASLTLPVPTITALGTTVSVAYTVTAGTDDWAREVGGYLLVYASRPFSPGRAQQKGGFRYAGKVSGAATPPTSPAVVTLPFASGPSGSKQQFQFVAVRADGRSSPVFPVVGTV
jgi:hypothetical protein